MHQNLLTLSRKLELVSAVHVTLDKKWILWMMWWPSHRGNWLFLILFSEHSLVYCNWTFDSILCWPPTVAGHATELKCPDQKVFDPTSKAKWASFHNRIWMDFFFSLSKFSIFLHMSRHTTQQNMLWESVAPKDFGRASQEFSVLRQWDGQIIQDAIFPSSRSSWIN